MKKRLRQYPKFSGPLSSLAFNCDGTKLAIAMSYTWDEGEAGLKTAQTPGIAIRKLGDEVKVCLFSFSVVCGADLDCSPRGGRGS